MFWSERYYWRGHTCWSMLYVGLYVIVCYPCSLYRHMNAACIGTPVSRYIKTPTQPASQLSTSKSMDLGKEGENEPVKVRPVVNWAGHIRYIEVTSRKGNLLNICRQDHDDVHIDYLLWWSQCPLSCSVIVLVCPCDNGHVYFDFKFRLYICFICAFLHWNVHNTVCL